MSTLWEISMAFKPPRTVFLDFPLGCPAGKPNEAELQRSVLRAALEEPRFLAIPGESSNFLSNGPRTVTAIGRKELGSFIAKAWERLPPMWPIIGREVNH
jgi:hypothetical protein